MSSSASLQSIEQTLAEVLSRLGSIENKLESGQGSGDVSASCSSGSEVPPAVIAFDAHVSSSLPPLLAAIDTIGSDELATAGKCLASCWDAMRTIVAVSSSHGRPSGSEYLEVLGELMKSSGLMERFSGLSKLGKDRDVTNHVKAITEALQCLSWVSMNGKPEAFVMDAVGSAEFWSNRIRKEYRNKDDEVSKAQITFCVKLSSLVKELSAYTKEWHTTGLAWGKGAALTKSAAQAGVDTVSAATTPTATATVKTKGAESKTVKAAPPVKSAADASEELKAALLAKTTGGNSAATGLKKVPRDQQTWRKEYKKDSATPAPASSAPSKAVTSVKAKSSSNKPPPPPKIEFHAPTNKWLVEHQVSPTQTPIVLTVDVTDLKHQVYIYKCTNVTVVVKGRFKNIIVDSCVRCNVIFDTVLISTEVFNGKSCKVQINGTCPSFVIDKTDGCQVYLSKETMAVTKFVTSKSSEMNVCWQDPSGDMKEVPIPEQFHHQLNPETGKISSEVSDLYTSNC